MHNGYLSSDMNDETQHRGLYRLWAQMMTADLPAASPQ